MKPNWVGMTGFALSIVLMATTFALVVIDEYQIVANVEFDSHFILIGTYSTWLIPVLLGVLTIGTTYILVIFYKNNGIKFKNSTGVMVIVVGLFSYIIFALVASIFILCSNGVVDLKGKRVLPADKTKSEVDAINNQLSKKIEKLDPKELIRAVIREKAKLRDLIKHNIKVLEHNRAPAVEVMLKKNELAKLEKEIKVLILEMNKGVF